MLLGYHRAANFVRAGGEQQDRTVEIARVAQPAPDGQAGQHLLMPLRIAALRAGDIAQVVQSIGRKPFVAGRPGVRQALAQ